MASWTIQMIPVMAAQESSWRRRMRDIFNLVMLTFCGSVSCSILNEMSRISNMIRQSLLFLIVRINMPYSVRPMKKIFPLLFSFSTMTTGFGATQLFLGLEYQAQAGANAGMIRDGDPASDAAFDGFLGTANLTNAEIIAGANCTTATPGIYASWGTIAQNATALNLGATTANVSIVGWDDNTGSLSGPSGSAVLAWSYNNGSALQAGAPRPGFASGAGSGYGIRTNAGSGSDGIRNAVQFSLTTPVSAFGIFGGDLETGGPNGSPLGFLYVTFTDGSTETIIYEPDATILGDASFSGTGNNQSETYGNETGRFVGIADDTRLISSVVFVVGDDDDGDDGDSEQLSFIAPMTFTEVTGGGECVNHVPTNVVPVPEPSSFLLVLSAGMLVFTRRRRVLMTD